jgi:hypothetical protein
MTSQGRLEESVQVYGLALQGDPTNAAARTEKAEAEAAMRAVTQGRDLLGKVRTVISRRVYDVDEAFLT